MDICKWRRAMAARSARLGGSACVPCLKKYFTSLKNQGLPMLARPIMAPSRPNSSRISMARSGELTSPLPNTGMCILELFFTAAICVQSASPLYICARVLPCMEIAFAPTS